MKQGSNQSCFHAATHPWECFMSSFYVLPLGVFLSLTRFSLSQSTSFVSSLFFTPCELKIESNFFESAPARASVVICGRAFFLFFRFQFVRLRLLRVGGGIRSGILPQDHGGLALSHSMSNENGYCEIWTADLWSWNCKCWPPYHTASLFLWPWFFISVGHSKAIISFLPSFWSYFSFTKKCWIIVPLHEPNFLHYVLSYTNALVLSLSLSQ